MSFEIVNAQQVRMIKIVFLITILQNFHFTCSSLVNIFDHLHFYELEVRRVKQIVKFFILHFIYWFFLLQKPDEYIGSNLNRIQTFGFHVISDGLCSIFK